MSFSAVSGPPSAKSTPELSLVRSMSMRKTMKANCLQALAAALACAAFAVPCAAQERYPSKPVRLVVPFPAAGPLDLVARVYALKLGERWGQTAVVENRIGATGTIGANAVAKA